MRKELKRQAKVGVGIEPLWKCLSKDLCSVLPKVAPNLVESAKAVEGDGRLGTVFLFTFGSGVLSMKYQKEKIDDLNKLVHRIGLQVETAVDVLEYELKLENEDDTSLRLKIISSSLAFIECLGDYLSKR
ncbi:phytohormone-binding protein-like isoform X1 [Punica granatum]|uniref:Phytohormone-binding protein-like isoform X1 n=1 Tax=Punica granatum TaxID=22663 RepID=A0A6P8ENZ6_PUNGR|nr:phytohormone-binding protein-like isoform X1 [Punica granatum]